MQGVSVIHYLESTDVCAPRDSKGQEGLAIVAVSLQPSVAIYHYKLYFSNNWRYKTTSDETDLLIIVRYLTGTKSRENKCFSEFLI